MVGDMLKGRCQSVYVLYSVSCNPDEILDGLHFCVLEDSAAGGY